MRQGAGDRITRQETVVHHSIGFAGQYVVFVARMHHGQRRSAADQRIRHRRLLELRFHQRPEEPEVGERNACRQIHLRRQGSKHIARRAVQRRRKLPILYAVQRLAENGNRAIPHRWRQRRMAWLGGDLQPDRDKSLFGQTNERDRGLYAGNDVFRNDLTFVDNEIKPNPALFEQGHDLPSA